MALIRTSKDDRLITVAGGVGSGATTLARGLAERICAVHQPAVAVSSGDLYRSFALLARRHASHLKPAREFTAGELVGLATQAGMQLSDGLVWLDGSAIDDRQLHTAEVSRLTPRWGGDQETHSFASKLIRLQIEAFEGFVIVEGRSPNVEFCGSLRLYLEVAVEVAAARKGCSIDDVIRRNTADLFLEWGPLAQSDQDHLLNTSWLSPEQVIDWAYQLGDPIFEWSKKGRD